MLLLSHALPLLHYQSSAALCNLWNGVSTELMTQEVPGNTKPKVTRLSNTTEGKLLLQIFFSPSELLLKLQNDIEVWCLLSIPISPIWMKWRSRDREDTSNSGVTRKGGWKEAGFTAQACSLHSLDHGTWTSSCRIKIHSLYSHSNITHTVAYLKA